MQHKQNLHTHTVFCDGTDTPEQMVLTAIDKGFHSLGFSGHSYTPWDLEYCMSLEGTQEYRRIISELRAKYSRQIDIYLGLEVEMLSEVDLSGYDYLIGSSHYFNFEGTIVPFDVTAGEVQQVIKDCFDNDGMKYAKAYYRQLKKLPEYGDFDIIGHFDLITKHSQSHTFFPDQSDEYLDSAFEALEALKGKIPFFEVNTGAIARGYRTTPYPALPIVKRMNQLGFKAIITSDCHRRQQLDCEFEQAKQLLKDGGFTERYVLTREGFVPVSLGEQ
ncbi:MAG: histidinol-phosphatase HisJ family protein [Bacillota bacterium]|nr:histidinol-phosphatase HisJ family protein [Bacillota bacterium]